MLRWSSLIAALFLLPGCASDPVGEEVLAGLESCPSPRPRACTRDYRPVCALLGNGERREYSNGCSACGDEAVSGFVVGPCAQ